MAVFAFFHIELTARILGVCLISEVTVCMIFGVLTLFGGGADGIPLKAINPAEIFSDSNTALGAAGVAMFASFWSWVGFEMAPNYAEESRDPRRIDGPGHLHLGDRPRRVLHVHLVDAGRRLGHAERQRTPSATSSRATSRRSSTR